MTTADLPVSSPSAEGVDAAGIEAALDAVAAAGIELHSLMVLRHGRVVTQGWWHPYAADRPHLLYSLSKSFTMTAVGLAVAEGLVDLDAAVLSYFPELDADITDPRSRRMTVRHLAAMASGHVEETLFRALAIDGQDLVRGFLLIPPDREPGTVFAYNQPCTYTLAMIVQRRSGQTLVDYLRPRLLDPLGIGPVSWLAGPDGRHLGFSGLHATTDAIARLGHLYLQGGRWDDRPLLDPSFVEQATRPQVATPDEPNPDWRQGYGYQFWGARHGYRGDGAYGQFCVVLPDQDMVVATTAATEDMQGILDALWTHLLPAVDAAPQPGADERLADRLATAALPLVPAAPEPEHPEQWDGTVFHGQAETDPGADSWPTPDAVTEARLTRRGGGWHLSVTDAGGSLAVRVGQPGWAVGESHGVTVATGGGWTTAEEFVADLRFLDTPHCVRLTCSLPGRRLTSRYPTTSLHVRSMLELRAP